VRRGLIVLVAGEAAAVAGLHRLGAVDGFAIPRRDLAQWLQATPSEDVLLAGIRLAALIAAWWLLATTVLYIAARVAHAHSAARAIGWATLPAVRRWADRAVAVSIVAASALAVARPAAGDPPPTTSPAPPPVVIDLDHRDRTSVEARPPEGVRTGRSQPPPPDPTAPPETPAPATPPAAPATPPAPPAAPLPAPHGARYAITFGEHLWSIAARQLAASTGRSIADLTSTEIALYWVRLVEDNRPHLRSGDPDLVYPDEVIELPPL
jgi:hypothetical protein